ncbi:YqhA family protein [Kiloniella laminariae]|uniref:YqhA family protein n=1 Tax=Kiloniella laminariae TaxID=454162 RepID=A0ABT4LDQ4_9PROT|nr:YqhA family protein [Kiloniella laminariae]MCZ4279233.1 YqhA family protein [Kiloniella laminariae]
MKWILPFRYISLVATAFSMIGSIFLFYLGSYKTYTAIVNYFQKNLPEEYSHLSDAEVALVGIVEAVDTFLFGLVLLILACGIYRIFVLGVSQPDNEQEASNNPHSNSWWHISTVTELKALLLEIVIVILAVLFLKSILLEQMTWELLIMPLGALFLAIILYLFKKMPH